MSNGYLVLTRKHGEELHFEIKDSDGSITEFDLTLDKGVGDQVRVAINAPLNVEVTRSEPLVP